MTASVTSHQSDNDNHGYNDNHGPADREKVSFTSAGTECAAWHYPGRRLPAAFGWLTKRGDAVTARWMRPVLTEPAIRRDTVRVLRAVAADRRLLVRAAESLRGYRRPVLVVWARADRVMPPEHARRLAEILLQARVAGVDDSYTLIPLDQPDRLAQLIREFSPVRSASCVPRRPEPPPG